MDVVLKCLRLENCKQQRIALLLLQGNIIRKWGFRNINSVALSKGPEQKKLINKYYI